jgi:hypothetical protein
MLKYLMTRANDEYNLQWLSGTETRLSISITGNFDGLKCILYHFQKGQCFNAAG